MKNRIKILHLENTPADAELIGSELIKHNLNFERVVVDSKQKFITALNNFTPDIILSDYSTSPYSTITALEIIQKLKLDIPFILVTDNLSDELADKMLRLGADDYIIKDRLNRLPQAVLNIFEKHRIERERKRLTKKIREKKRETEESIRISIERYELIAKATSDMVWDWNLQTGEIYRSKEGWKRIFSASTDEVPNSPEAWSERIHPDDIENAKKTEESVWKNPDVNVFQLECRVLNDDNNYITIVDKGYVIRDERGKPIRLVGVTKNITEKKMAEEIINASEARYRNLFEGNPASIFLWDLETFCIKEVNETATKVYGYSKEEFCKLSILDLRHKKDYNKIKALAGVFKSECPLQSYGVWKHISKTGKTLYMNITANSIMYNGRITVLAMANNVTERITLQKNLEKEKAVKQKAITSAVIIAQEKEREILGCELHDNVNQILASSLIYLGVAKKGIDIKNILEETEKLINSAIHEIRTLTHSLIPPFFEETSLKNALSNIVKITGVNSNFTIHSSLECLDETDMSGDLKLNIYRIVQEQFSNIVKHAKALHVYLTLQCDSRQIILTIKDDGIGFDPLKKSEGVGLMNIKTRASIFNGKVTIQSFPGQGSELSITFAKKPVSI